MSPDSGDYRMSVDKSNSTGGDGFRRVEDLFQKIQLEEATSSEIDEFNHLILGDIELRRRTRDLLIDETILRSELSIIASSDQFSSVNRSFKETDLSAQHDPESGTQAMALDAFASGQACSDVQLQPRKAVPAPPVATGLYRVGQLAVSCMIGALATLAAVKYLSDDAPKPQQHATVAKDGPAIDASLTRVAHVISSTGVLWSEFEGRRISPGTPLAAGDTLRLANGVGTVELRNGVAVYMQGPAEIEIGLGGLLTVQHGLACVGVPEDVQGQEILTSLSTIELSPSALVGIRSTGSVLEVHSFQGVASVFAAPIYANNEVYGVGDGKAVHAEISHRGNLRFKEMGLGVEKFADLKRMVDEQLVFPSQYVDAVLSAEPIHYWRFENATGDYVSDEISGEATCLLTGAARIVAQGGSSSGLSASNHVVHFGYGSEHGAITSIDPLRKLSGDSYTLELWVKPTHNHHGVLATLLSHNSQIGRYEHGVILELRDPFSTSSSIRFLHRLPAGPAGGTECYSSSQYTAGRWQHVAAVKSSGTMRLFIDGIVTAEEEDSTHLHPELRLVMGQLYPEVPVRPFVGQIDELAIYNYAVSGEELSLHHGLRGK